MVCGQRRSGNVRRRLAGALLLVSLLGWADLAFASPSYGYYLIAAFRFRPGCTGCHSSATGGAGTVTQPFGLTLIELGLTGGDNYQLLVDTLNALGESDSDGDGASDRIEVIDGGDPNDPNVVPEGFVPPDEPEPGTEPTTPEPTTMPQPSAPSSTTEPPTPPFPGMETMEPPASDGCALRGAQLGRGTESWPWSVGALAAAGMMAARRRLPG